MKTRISIIITGLLFAFSSAAFAAERVDKVVPATSDGVVEIENMSGSITVSGWDKSEVRVEGDLDEWVEDFVFENDGEFTEIKVKYPNQRRGWGDEGHRNIGSDLRISVPKGSRLSISSISASVDVSEVSGTLEIETISGSMDVASKGNELELETISGDIRLSETIEGVRVNAESVSGSMRITGLKGEIEAGSVSGNINLSRSAMTRAEFVNTSGDINVEADFADKGVYRFKSISGDVDVTFNNTPNANFDVSTFSGDIDNDFGPEPKKVSRYTPNQELKFTAGNGSSEVTISTMSGDVEIRE